MLKKSIYLIPLFIFLLSIPSFSMGSPPEATTEAQPTTKAVVRDPKVVEAEISKLEKDIEKERNGLDLLAMEMYKAREEGDAEKFKELEKDESNIIFRINLLKDKLASSKKELSDIKEGKVTVIKKEIVEPPMIKPIKEPKTAPEPKPEPKKEVELPKVEEKPAQKIVYHYVTVGDTLSSISRRYYGSPNYYRQIAELNDIDDPSAIYQGMKLKIDLSIAGSRARGIKAESKRAVSKIIYHTVGGGDTLYSISRKYFGTPRYYLKIANMNGIDNPNALRKGMRLKVDMGIAPPATRIAEPTKAAEPGKPGSDDSIKMAPIRIEYASVDEVKKKEATKVYKEKIVYHYLNPGETLATVSEKYYGTPNYLKEIAKMNNIEDIKNVPLGTKLKIDVNLKDKIKSDQNL